MLRAHGVPLPDEGRPAADVVVDALTVGAHAEGWRLRAPGSVRLDGRALTLALELTGHGQALGLRGTVARPSGRFDLALHGRGLDASRLATIARVALPPTALDFDAHLRGTQHAPELTVKVRGRVEGVDLAIDGAYARRRARATLEGAIGGERVLALRAESHLDAGRSARPLASARSWPT